MSEHEQTVVQDRLAGIVPMIILTAGVIVAVVLWAVLHRLAEVGPVKSADARALAAVVLLVALTLAGLLAVVVRLWLDSRRHERELEAAASRLAEQERQYRWAFEDNPLPLLIFERASARTLAANNAACRQYGYRASELFALTANELLAVQEREAGATRIRDAARVTGLHPVERHRKKGGGWFDAEVARCPIRFDGHEADLLLVVDVTEKLQLERELREGVERFVLISQATADAIWDWDLRTGVVWWGEGLYESFGYPPQETGPDTEFWYARIHPEDVDRVRVHLTAVFDAGQRHWEDEYRFRRWDGRWAQVHDRGFVMRDEGGRPVRMVGGLSDISARKAAEAALERTLDQLRRKNTELQEFAYVASHDLQEPLRKIRAFSERVAGGLPCDAAQTLRDDLERVQASATRMSDLIESLLAYSRLTSLASGFSRVDLNVTVQEVLADLGEVVRECRAELVVGPLPEIDAEPAQMRQLFQNLIGNALKFHDPNGVPHIEIHAAQSVRAGVPEPVCGSEVELHIEDNGVGFDQRHAERIFAPFQRLHGHDAYPGSGIGLSIVRRIVDYHGGSVAVRSQPGLGTRFIVTLPTRQRRASSPDSARSSGGPAPEREERDT